MVEISEVDELPRLVENVKHENDLSYDKSDDSGVKSMTRDESSLTTVTKSGDSSYGYESSGLNESEISWRKIKNEVIDPMVFDPPLLHSNNLIVDVRISDISTIEHDGVTVKPNKGR